MRHTPNMSISLGLLGRLVVRDGDAWQAVVGARPTGKEGEVVRRVVNGPSPLRLTGSCVALYPCPAGPRVDVASIRGLASVVETCGRPIVRSGKC